MPLHLLGKKSWNVYNPSNIARVKADEAAAAAREAAEDERRQEVDAARRAALLRGETPPPLPEDEEPSKDEGRTRGERREREPKRRKLRGEDDTDMDIRLASSARGGRDESAKTMQLRKPDSDAPLTDHAGNINLFPVDGLALARRERNEEAEKEKRNKERALEDQYTMRFSNAAGRGGLVEKPWYTDSSTDGKTLDLPSKDVWGKEDPRRKDREQARIISNDPFAFMQHAQAQLKRAKEDKKKWSDERERELRQLKVDQDSESQRHKRRREDDGGHRRRESRDRHGSSRHRHHHRSRGRSRSPNREKRRRGERQSPERRKSSHRQHGRRCERKEVG